jgi:uracil-DNA glycosylase
VQELGGRTVFLLPLFHPAAALRTPAVAETLRADFATLPQLLVEELPGRAANEPEQEGPQPEAAAVEPDQLGFFG